MSYLEYRVRTVPTGLRKILYINWPLVLLLVAVAFGGLQVGGLSIQSLGVSSAVASILQALILFGAIGAAVLSTYQIKLIDRKVAS